MRRPWVVGVSGASGTPYARALLREFRRQGEPVDLIVSQAARLTLLDETGIGFHDDEASVAAWLGPPEAGGGTGAADRPAAGWDLRIWGPRNLAAGPSSGSYRTRGMVVIPASTACCAGIALGLSKDLLQRCADVHLKERRRLVVVPRETPLARPTLVHLLALHDAGAVVLPASPGFYAGPATVEDLVNFVAGKVLDVLDVDHDLYRRWSGRLGEASGARRGAPLDGADAGAQT